MSWWGKKADKGAGVEFWHSPERSGWLTKQGGVHACEGDYVTQLTLKARSRRLHQDMAQAVSSGMNRVHMLQGSSLPGFQMVCAERGENLLVQNRVCDTRGDSQRSH